MELVHMCIMDVILFYAHFISYYYNYNYYYYYYYYYYVPIVVVEACFYT